MPVNVFVILLKNSILDEYRQIDESISASYNGFSITFEPIF